MNQELKLFVVAAMNSHDRRERLSLLRPGQGHSFCSCGWEPDEALASSSAQARHPGNAKAQRARFTDEMITQWSDHTTDVVLGAVADWLEQSLGHSSITPRLIRGDL